MQMAWTPSTVSSLLSPDTSNSFAVSEFCGRAPEKAFGGGDRAAAARGISASRHLHLGDVRVFREIGDCNAAEPVSPNP